MTQTEEILLAFWRDIFARGEIGVEDDFFVLGGHSLLAARLSARIVEVFGFELPLAQVFETPTISELATLIDQQRTLENPDVAASALVCFKAGAGRAPLFCMHNLIGGIGDYILLARHLPAEQPVYAVQGCGLVGDALPLTSLPAMAQHCISALRKVQPHGPYHVAGSSFAGLVAFEVAQQLYAAGEEVALLALFDTWLHTDPAQPRLVAQLRASVKAQHPQTTYLSRRREQQERINVARLAALAPQQQLAYLRGSAPQAPTAAAPAPPEYLDLETRYNSILEGSEMALARYVPAPYPGRIVYFHASERDDAPELDQQRAWTHLARGGLAVHPLPCNHHQMLGEPNVRLIAKTLSEYMRDA